MMKKCPMCRKILIRKGDEACINCTYLLQKKQENEELAVEAIKLPDDVQEDFQE